jgi:hypothetical protein
MQHDGAPMVAGLTKIYSKGQMVSAL